MPKVSADSKSLQLIVRGAYNLPQIGQGEGEASDLCNACAFVCLGDQQFKTAVVTGAGSAFWEEEFGLQYDSLEDELAIELIHCDSIGPDWSLGSARIALAGLLSSQATALAFAAGAIVERDVPLGPAGPAGALPVTLKLGMSIPGRRHTPPPSDSDDELPRSELLGPPTTPPPAQQPPLAAESVAGNPPDPRAGRGGVGLKFKVPPPLLPPAARAFRAAMLRGDSCGHWSVVARGRSL